jgi:hypothetical protein
LTACALPQDVTHPRSLDYSMTAASGVPMRLDFVASVNPDCSDMGRPTVRLSQTPRHGTVQIAPTMDFPRFPTGDVRNACNQRRIAGTSAHYVSRAGYVGSDLVGIDIIYVTGGLIHHTFSIDVK